MPCRSSFIIILELNISFVQVYIIAKKERKSSITKPSNTFSTPNNNFHDSSMGNGWNTSPHSTRLSIHFSYELLLIWATPLFNVNWLIKSLPAGGHQREINKLRVWGSERASPLQRSCRAAASRDGWEPQVRTPTNSTYFGVYLHTLINQRQKCIILFNN